MNLEVVELLKKIGKIECFSANDIIFKENEDAYDFYIILNGSVKIIKNNEFDGSLINLASIGSGKIFGELSFIMNEKRSASAIAENDVTTVKVSHDDFLQFITVNPKLSINLLKTVMNRHEENLRKLGVNEDAYSKIY